MAAAPRDMKCDMGRARLHEVLGELNRLEELEYSGELEEQLRANLELSLAAVREKEGECVEKILNADDAVLHAKPRTRGGAVAQLMFAAELLAEQIPLDEDGPEFSDDNRILPLLVNAAQMIDWPLFSKIGLSERLAKILSFADQEA